MAADSCGLYWSKKKILIGEAAQFSCFFLSLHIIVGAKNLLMCACFCSVSRSVPKREKGGETALIGGLYWDTSLSSFDLSLPEML